MKKQTAMFFTFSALLTLNAFAPQVLWQEKKYSRQPASLEEDRLEALELKKSEQLELLELVEVQLKEDRSVVEVKVEEPTQCQNDNKSAQLEEQIKKLVEDKDSILKELQELKDLKKARKEASAKGVKKAKAENVEKEQVEVIDIMSQLSNLMISQQAQQQMMMEHMFSMMPRQQQQPRRFSLNDYMPYTIDHSEYEMYSNGSFHAMGRRIGISYPSFAPQNYYSPYAMMDQFRDEYSRMPSNEMQQPQRYNNPSAYVAPQQPGQQQQIPHNGFNFSNGSNIERVNF